MKNVERDGNNNDREKKQMRIMKLDGGGGGVVDVSVKKNDSIRWYWCW